MAVHGGVRQRDRLEIAQGVCLGRHRGLVGEQVFAQSVGFLVRVLGEKPPRRLVLRGGAMVRGAASKHAASTVRPTWFFALSIRAASFLIRSQRVSCVIFL
jgi:hypothetical protein